MLFPTVITPETSVPVKDVPIHVQFSFMIRQLTRVMVLGLMVSLNFPPPQPSSRRASELPQRSIREAGIKEHGPGIHQEDLQGLQAMPGEDHQGQERPFWILLAKVILRKRKSPFVKKKKSFLTNENVGKINSDIMPRTLYVPNAEHSVCTRRYCRSRSSKYIPQVVQTQALRPYFLIADLWSSITLPRSLIRRVYCEPLNSSSSVTKLLTLCRGVCKRTLMCTWWFRPSLSHRALQDDVQSWSSTFQSEKLVRSFFMPWFGDWSGLRLRHIVRDVRKYMNTFIPKFEGDIAETLCLRRKEEDFSFFWFHFLLFFPSF